MSDFLTQLGNYPLAVRLIVFIGIVAITHLVVILIRRAATHFLAGLPSRRYQKMRSVATLTTSAVVFVLYFFAIGLCLREFGVSLTAYLASASVVGLAIGFGSQGIVQDVVTGLTLIFSDLIDVGDLVEISGQSGIVRAITMRFVQLQNALGATVYIPNRTITNIINYPRGYVRCIVDITLRGDEASRAALEKTALTLMHTVHEQFPGILLTPPSNEGRIQLKSGKEFLRLKFRLWPNRGQPIETSFLQELLMVEKQNDPEYQAWMVNISYEVEEQKRIPATKWPWRNRAES